MGFAILAEDTLYEIFLHLAEEYPITGPLYVSHCCRHWRSVALNAPMLWTYISINQPKLQYIDRLKTWMERSGTNNIHIGITEPESLGGFSNYVGQCLEVLVIHAHRWKVLKAWTRSLNITDSCSFANLHLPELTELSLDFGDSSSSSGSQWVVEAKTPKLMALALEGPITWTPSMLERTELFHPHLKTLRISSWLTVSSSLEVSLAMLHKCPFLEVLDLELIWYLANHEKRSPQLFHPLSHEVSAMPNLRSMNLRGVIGNTRLPLVLRIQAPTLVTLESPILLGHIPPLLSLPLFPFPALKHLSLRAPLIALESLDPSHVIEFLSQLPNLYQLTLIRFAYTSLQYENYPFLRALASLCPSLQALVIEGGDGGGTDDEIRRLIEARQHQTSQGIHEITSLAVHRGSLLMLSEHNEWFKTNVKTYVFDTNELGL